MTVLLPIALGYLLGSIPWGYWLPRALRGADIREFGSGNTGAANVWRAFGFKLGLPVAILDIGKGTAATVLGLWFGGELVGVLTGVAAMTGHWRPLFMGLARGGKVVATTGGVGLALAPLGTLAASVVWVIAFVATGYTSVASLSAALAFPFLVVALGASWPVVAFAAGAGCAIVVLHRGNIGRLRRGTENRFQLLSRLQRRTKSMETGTPASSKRSRSWFSTQKP